MDESFEHSERVHSTEQVPTASGDSQHNSTVVHHHYHYHHHYYHNSPPPHHHHHRRQRSTSRRTSPHRSHGSPSRYTLPSRWASDASERSEGNRRVDEWNGRARPSRIASPANDQESNTEGQEQQGATAIIGGEVGEINEADTVGGIEVIDGPIVSLPSTPPARSPRGQRNNYWRNPQRSPVNTRRRQPRPRRSSRSLSREFARLRLQRSDSTISSPDRSLQRSPGRLQRSRLAFMRRPFGSLSSPAEHLRDAIEGERTQANVRKLFLTTILLIREQEDSVSSERGWQLVTERLISAGAYPGAEEAHTAWTAAFGESAATVLEDLFLMPRQGAYRTVADLLVDN